jgi:23S rRNA (adenine2503-C2)-methyltransferase
MWPAGMSAVLHLESQQATIPAKPSLAGRGREGLREGLAAVGVPEKQLKMRVGQLWS